MRISPKPEQLSYLLSLGIPQETLWPTNPSERNTHRLAQPLPSPAKISKRTRRKASCAMLWRWLKIIGAVVGIAASSQQAWGQEQPLSPPASSSLDTQENLETQASDVSEADEVQPCFAFLRRWSAYPWQSLLFPQKSTSEGHPALRTVLQYCFPLRNLALCPATRHLTILWRCLGSFKNRMQQIGLQTKRLVAAQKKTVLALTRQFLEALDDRAEPFGISQAFKPLALALSETQELLQTQGRDLQQIKEQMAQTQPSGIQELAEVFKPLALALSETQELLQTQGRDLQKIKEQMAYAMQDQNEPFVIQETHDELTGISLMLKIVLGFLVFLVLVLTMRGSAMEKSLTQQPSAKMRRRLAIGKETAPRQPLTSVEIVHPESIIPQIAREVQNYEHILVKPQNPTGTWNLGIASSKGPVRGQNQDYGVAFTMDHHQILMIADGCGGTPYGDVAAFLAVSRAARSLISSLGTKFGFNETQAISMAIHEAYCELGEKGAALGLPKSQGALRTTLILVVGFGDAYAYGYIGDGGGYLVRATGQVERFLVPQKGGYSNVLAASLGPKIQGQPVIGCLDRRPGDLVLVGTDGVFDYSEDSLPLDILRGAMDQRGNLQKVAEQVVREMAAIQDQEGYICDDNLTLGLMGDCRAPNFAETGGVLLAQAPRGTTQEVSHDANRG